MAVAYILSRKMKQYCLLTQTHFELNDLEESLIGKMADPGGSDFERDVGTDALVRYFKAGILTQEMIYSCTISLGDGLSLLLGSGQRSRESYENAMFTSILLKIYKAAEDFFDIVMIDVNSGYSDRSMEMIENADLAVVVLRQGRRMPGEFIKTGFPFEVRNRFYLFARYSAESRYSLHNMKKLHKCIVRSNSGTVPFDAGYGDAIDERKVLKYLDGLEPGTDMNDYDGFYAGINDCAEKIYALMRSRREG